MDNRPSKVRAHSENATATETLDVRSQGRRLLAPWLLPAETSTTGGAMLTCTGVVRSVVEPSPTCPDAFAPQHQSVASVFTAQVVADPVDTLTTSVPRATTGMGLV